jgi:DNA excision repair protein ERCC-4
LNNICSKLSLLIIAFPKLRILWARSPHVTAEVFKTLKAGRLDADPDQAMAIGNKSYLNTEEDADDGAVADSSVEAEVRLQSYS